MLIIMSKRRFLTNLSSTISMQFRLFTGLLALTSTGVAQTVTVKLINGRNGQPVASACVTVSAENRMAAMLVTDQNGIAPLNIMGDNKDRWQNCGVHGVANTNIKNDDVLRIGVDQYLVCQPRASNGSRHLVENVSTRQVVDRGFVTPNDCGKYSALAGPGEITVFIRPYNFWEVLRSIPGS